MATVVVSTQNGKDFTNIWPAVLVDTNGKASGIQVVSTQAGKDFTNIKPCIEVNINGQA